MADTDNNRDALITEFCSITGADPDRGRLYLEAAAWSIELALASYFEETDEASETPVGIQPTAPASSASQSSARDQPTSDKSKPQTSSPPQMSNRFATLANLIKDDSSDEEGQAFYAGGSERSGQQVLGPGKKKSDDLIAEMFKAAKEHGAQVIDPTEASKSKSKPAAFKGTGHRLGSTEAEAEVIETGQGSPQGTRSDMCLKLWKNGFSVDDGPLRDYADPANKEFLESIRRGEVPRELVRMARGEVNLNMEDHRTEEYVPPKRKVQAFAGEGYRLGSPAPAVLGAGASSGNLKDSEANAKKILSVDSSKPTTNIQVRLSDGTRLVITMNQDHTVGDIRRYIVNARPAYEALEFSLLTTFPNRELDDDGLTLEQANILNAVIVQRLK